MLTEAVLISGPDWAPALAFLVSSFVSMLCAVYVVLVICVVTGALEPYAALQSGAVPSVQ